MDELTSPVPSGEILDETSATSERTTRENTKTPARKRRADAEPEPSKKTDNSKKSRSTYTPKTQATKSLKKAAGTPIRTPNRREMASGGKEEDGRPLRMNDIKACFEDLGKSLSTSLTQDFTKAITVVGDRVNTNTRSIDEIRGAIKKLENTTAASNGEFTRRFEQLESAVTESRSNDRRRSALSSESSGNHDIDLRVDPEGRSQSFTNHERYTIARRSIRIWPVPGESDTQIWDAALKFMREKMGVNDRDLGDEDIQTVRRTRLTRKS